MRKLMIVGPFPYPDATISGGVERVIDTSISHLQDSWEITVVVPNSICDHECFDGRARFIYHKKGFIPAAFTNLFFLPLWLRRIEARVEPDVIHFHGMFLYAVLCRSPKIWTIHGFLKNENIIKTNDSFIFNKLVGIYYHLLVMLERLVSLQASRIIIISEYTKQIYQYLANRHTERIDNPVDEKFLNITPSKKSAPKNIAVIGKLSKLKRFPDTLEVARKLIEMDPEYSFNFFGDFDLNFITSHIENLPEFVKKRIVFSGSLSASDLGARLQSCGCVLVCSYQENAPMAICEAHVLGLPVVAPHAFGVPEMVTDRMNGLFYSQTKSLNDIQEIIDSMQEAQRIDWDNDQIALNAREIYSAGQINAKLNQVYDAVMNK